MVGTGIEQRVSDFRAKENQLHTSLDNLRGDRKKVKEYRAIDKELKSIVRKRQNLEAALALSDGMFVHKPPTDKCGVIFEILITPGGHAEVWVSWDGGVPIVEQPELLVIDKCDYSIVSPESALFHTQEGSLEFVPPNLLKLDNSSKQSCDHTLEKSPSMTTSELLIPDLGNTTLPVLESLALLSPEKDDKEQQATSATCSPIHSDLSENVSPNGSSLKMSLDCSMPPSIQEQKEEHSFNTYSGNYPAAGTWANGLFSVQPALDCHTIVNGSLSLPTPTALSSFLSRPPGQNKLEVRLKALGLVARGETVNPEFLEMMHGLPRGWTDVELEQKEEIVLSAEEEKSLEIPFVSPPQQQLCKESFTSTLLQSEESSQDTHEEAKLLCPKLSANYGMMEELLPAHSVTTDGGIENNKETLAMDHHTISSTDVAAKNFSVGDRVKSISPVFPDTVCIISALPSREAAIVEMENGARERLLVEHLEPLNGKQKLKNDLIPLAPLFEIIEELSPDEERERHRLELKVDLAFYEAGKSLATLRDRRLYRSTHKTFEEYCKERFGFTRQSASLKILAAEVIDDLSTNGCQILPNSERQVRPIIQAGLQPEEQRAIWQQAVDLADGKVPTGRIVKGVVERLLEKPLNFASEYCSVGEIFRLQRLVEEEQKYNGWWGIALEVENRFTVKCEVYDTTIEIRQENIKRIDMTTDETVKQQEIIERVSRLARCNLDPVAWALLEALNRQAYHSDYQLQMLKATENYYLIHSYEN